ncbi:MAG: TonB C-terminal domain-containing protein, partial [Candidatus Binatia bacterium]
MAEESASPTIGWRERTLALVSAEDQLPKWLTLSFVLHVLLIVTMFAVSFMPRSIAPAPPVYVVDLIGGERIGRTNFGTEIAPVQKPAAKRSEPEDPAVAEPKREKNDKLKIRENKTPVEEKSVKEQARSELTKDAKNEAKAEASADSVRERLILAAAERAKARTESAQKASAKGENFSAGAGEGDGAAALGAGGRGGPGVLKGMDFVIYQNRMLSTIKENWAWVGQRGNLKVVVQFGIKDNGEITGLKVVQPSGDATYDESVLR